MIFFDIDNTLIDQHHADRIAAAVFIEKYGNTLKITDVDAFARLWHSLREKHGREFLQGRISPTERRRRRVREIFVPLSLNDAEADARYGFFQAHYRGAWRLYDDVLPCLHALKGLPLGIISNGSSAQQSDKLRTTAITDYFSLTVVSEEAGVAKPARAIFLEACRRAGKNPEECIYVGDHLENDARASRAAGLRGVWLNRLHRHEAAAGAMLESLDQLGDLARERIAA